VVMAAWGFASETLLYVLHDGPAEEMAGAMKGIIAPLVEVLMSPLDPAMGRRGEEMMVTVRGEVPTLNPKP